MNTQRKFVSAARALVAALFAACCLMLPAGCGARDPFGYVQVSGRVTYDDGSLIPVDGLLLTFIPQGGELDPKTYPRPGMTTVERATGEFHLVTSHKFGDGLVRGKHKVTLAMGAHVALPPSVVPPEYYDPATTPLEVDTASLPFVLKVRKPR
jgi:hypothetical protein